MNRSGLIAKREYWTNVTRWDFLLLTFGLPLLGLLITVVAALPVFLMAQSVPSHLEVGIVDETGRFNFPTEIKGRRYPGLAGKLTPPQTAYTLRRFPSRGAAEEALANDRVAFFLIVPKDYVENGELIRRSNRRRKLFSGEPMPPLRAALVRGLLEGRVEEAVVERALYPVSVRRELPKGATGPGGPESALSEMGRLLVPYAFTMILMVSIFAASGYLLRGIADEKEGRIIEIVLSSVSPGELFVGKLIGLSGVGLTQVAVWVCLGMLPAMMVLPFVELPLDAVLLAPVFFLLGFLLYGTIMAGIGALGSSWRESQQLCAGVSVLVALPVILFPVLMDAPNSALALGFSLFPFSAPLVMMIRLAVTEVPWWQVGLSAALLIACIRAFARLAIRLFRTAALMYGKRPTVREILRWLRAA